MSAAPDPPRALDPTPRPYNLVAELTYRCPLRCVYCSNPVGYESLRDGLSADDWGRVFRQAAELGAIHVGLTGGEPAARSDLPEIVAGAAEAQLFAHLVTAGTLLDRGGLETLVTAGLRSVQLSLQDVEAQSAERIAGVRSFERKLRFAADVRALELPLTLNVVLHRHNLDRTGAIIDLAAELGAHRLELANAQYHGFALANRDALLPDRAQLEAASRAVAEGRRRHPRLELVFVLPDYFSDRPKPCMGGWGHKNLVIAPDGLALPCHDARELPGLEFWSVRDRSVAACWRDAPGMNAFRGDAWMREPCRSCPDRTRDFGGCRCQAFRLTGDPAATDPACSLSPDHGLIAEARRAAERRTEPSFLYREPLGR